MTLDSQAGSPIAVLTTSFAFRLKSPSVRLISIILIICSGVGIASWGEAEFNLIGFLIQVVAIIVEATRVTMIQLLLHGAGLTPMFSLYLFAPVSFRQSYYRNPLRWIVETYSLVSCKHIQYYGSLNSAHTRIDGRSLLVLILPVEGLAPLYQLPQLGFHILLLNAALTFALSKLEMLIFYCVRNVSI